MDHDLRVDEALGFGSREVVDRLDQFRNNFESESSPRMIASPLGWQYDGILAVSLVGMLARWAFMMARTTLCSALSMLAGIVGFG